MPETPRPKADLQLCERIETAYDYFRTHGDDREVMETLNSLYGQLVALDRRDDEASLETLFELARRDPDALAMMTYRALHAAED